MLKRIDTTVKEIWGMLLIYGVVVQLAGMWFVRDKLRYTVGLWLGIALAIFMIWHMHLGISKALDLDAGGAQKKMLMMYGIRLVVVCAVVLCVFFFKIGNVILTFIGVFGLKIAAYLQPSLHGYLAGRAEKGR